MFSGLITHIAEISSIVFSNAGASCKVPDLQKPKKPKKPEKPKKSPAASLSAKLEIKVSDLDMQDIKVGESIALNGVCLTVVSKDNKNKILSFDISSETYAQTSFKYLNSNLNLNLERALLVSDRLGGHIVAGHVDSLARIIDIKHISDDNMGKYLDIIIAVDKKYMCYIANKGSVAIDGVSLTVNLVVDRLDGNLKSKFYDLCEDNLDIKNLSSNDYGCFSVMVIPHTQEKTIIGGYEAGQYVNLEVDLLARYASRYADCKN